MVQIGWVLASTEGTGPSDDIVQHSPRRTSPDLPVRGWVSLPVCGGTTSPGFFRPPRDMGIYLVFSPDRLQSPPFPPPPFVDIPH